MNDQPDAFTERLVGFVDDLDADRLPASVQHECVRALVDAVGCMVGGGRHPLVNLAHGALSEFFGPAQAQLFGRGERTDMLHAALLNGLAGAAYSFFDTYSDALLHPGVPAAAVLLALSERNPVSGPEFIAAFAAGMEVACRLTKCTALPPAEADMGWSQTGIICGAATALAAGKLLGLGRDQLGWALGIAASEAAGTRAEHGSMAASLIFGHAPQTGLRAALLASRGFTSSPRTIESRHGFASTFAKRPNLPALVEGLGEVFELLRNTYKPFPCGIVNNSSIDAMLQLKEQAGFESSTIARIEMKVSKGAATFGMRPNPVNEQEAKLSLHHWVAAAALHGRAGIAEGRLSVVQDPEIVRLRAAMNVEPDPSMAQDAAEMTVVFADGSKVHKRIEHCVGSIDTPMSDAQIERKFIDQAGIVIGTDRAVDLAAACWKVASLPDVSVLAREAI